MEYVIVELEGGGALPAAVLINRQRMGTTGEVIALGEPGYVVISVDVPEAEARTVDVQRTSPTYPLRVVVACRVDGAGFNDAPPGGGS